MEEFFTVQEGVTTFVCRKQEDGCVVLAHCNEQTNGWVLYHRPFYWEEECLRPTTRRITKAEVTAIFLMGKKEAEI